ncbi:MAG: KGK domain-containing protein [Coleofasciculus sp. G3-WIS-01]|uniref:KGK domain-containing protein n=1 Tax=Coleofasciculus sp. G3-WIS-01 TaxID=3069528 RepID=UPI003302D1EB
MTTVELSGFKEDDVISGVFPDIRSNPDLNEGLTIAKLVEDRFKGHCISLQQGVDCRLLRTTGGGWREGKIRLQVNVTIDFIPDEPDIEPPPGALVKS